MNNEDDYENYDDDGMGHLRFGRILTIIIQVDSGTDSKQYSFEKSIS